MGKRIGSEMDGAAAHGKRPGKRTDKRIERSHALVLSALKRLLARQGTDRLTISSVAREAGVDRKTIYARFGSIDGMYEALAEESVRRILDEVERTCGTVTSITEHAEQGTQAFFLAINRAILAEEALDRSIMENVPAERLVTMLSSTLGRTLLERHLVPSSVPAELYGYYLQFIVSGILAVYRTWLLSDQSAPLERVSAVARQLTMEGIAALH